MLDTPTMPRNTAIAVLDHWNELAAVEAAREILPCCGSRVWAERMAARRPMASPEDLFATSDEIWLGLNEADWQEAFDSHPRIGQRHAKAATAESLQWSGEEQKTAMARDEAVSAALQSRNRGYEARFGRIFIVCASGKSAAEILEILERRLNNTADAELREAVEQQRQITQLRLRRWTGVD